MKARFWFPLCAFFSVGLSTTTHAWATLDCQGLNLCINAQTKGEFCCPRTAECGPTSCIPMDETPSCMSTSACGTACQSNSDCGGMICVYDENADIGYCSAHVDDEPAPSFTCAVASKTSSGITELVLVGALAAHRLRGRSRKRFAE